MKILKRFLLLFIVGSVSIILAGCYGARVRQDESSSIDFPQKKGQPLTGLKMVEGSKSLEKAGK